MRVTHSQLEERVRLIPRQLEASVEAPLPSDDESLDAETRFVVTGVGASELPARTLSQCLRGAGFDASFLPVASFLDATPIFGKTALVVFSQGLSPNAQLPLRRRKDYESTVLFTAIDPARRDDRGDLARDCQVVVRHLPESETGTLARFVGPMCAALTALRWAARLIARVRQRAPAYASLLSRVPARYEAALASGHEPLRKDLAACVCAAEELSSAMGLMWKWQEALYTPLSPAIDWLSFAHGPLQSFMGRPATFLALQSEGSVDFVDKLGATVDSQLHVIELLQASLPAPLSLFEYDAMVNARVLCEMRRRHIDPGNWPGRTADESLYSIDGKKAE